MKRVIRKCVWETNSSSVHSVSIRGKRDTDGFYHAPPNGILEITLDEYGWYGEPCNCFDSKLSYAMAMVLATEYPKYDYWREDFYVDQDILENLPGYKLLLDAINLHFNYCKQILINRLDGYYPYGYIDHQSCEGYKCLQDFLDDWNVDVERFLFDDGVVVWIDNDNH